MNNTWTSAKTIKDLSNAYSSIYEAKMKVDQDEDGDNDFADVRIARMVASGVPKEVAIQRVKGKSYNEEFDLDEGLGSAIGRFFSKNKPQKQPLKSGRIETLRKKYNVTSSTGETSASGRKLQRSARFVSADRAKYGEGSSASRESSAAHKKYLQAGASLHGSGELQLGQSGARGGKARRRLAAMRGTDVMNTKLSHNEEFESWVNSLLDEGYDLSDYTINEMYDLYLDEGLGSAIRKVFGGGRKKVTASPKPESRGEYLRRKYNTGPDMSDTSAKRKILDISRARAERDKERYGNSKYSKSVAKDSEDAYQRYLRAGWSKYGASAPPRGRGNAARRKQSTLNKEDYDLAYDIIATYLLENNFAGTINDANVIIENMSEVWVNGILNNN